MLFKFGDFDFTKYIQAHSFKPIPNARFDLDSFTDMEGVTHRNALKHTRTKITFTMVPMSAAEMREVMNGLTNNYLNYEERDAECTYFDVENWTKKTGHFYLNPNTQWNIDYWDETTGLPEHFGTTELIFTEY